MEKVRPWCGQPSDRGRLQNRTVKSRLVSPFWYQLTRVVPDKGPLNVCARVCVRACVRACVFVPAHTGSPGQRAVKRVCVCVFPAILSFHLFLQSTTFLVMQPENCALCFVMLTHHHEGSVVTKLTWFLKFPFLICPVATFFTMLL